MLVSRISCLADRPLTRVRAWAAVIASVVALFMVPNAIATDIDSQLGAPLTKRVRPTLGSPDAPIVVIEVRSFKCPHCRAFHQRVFPELRERHINSGKIHWVSINATPDAPDINAAAFTLARCALQLGVYPQVETFLFQNGARSSSFLYSRASSVEGVNASEFDACVRHADVLREVREDFAEVTALKVTVLPTFILRKRKPDGSFVETRIEGYPQADYFDRVLAELQAKP
jgi:protein-disulfide isomerase